MKLKLIAAAVALAISNAAFAAEPTNDELLELIKKQETQIQ